MTNADARVGVCIPRLTSTSGRSALSDVKLYVKLYLGQLIQPSVEAFITGVWELVGASQMSSVES
jgi:hypothetical protein